MRDRDRKRRGPATTNKDGVRSSTIGLAVLGAVLLLAGLLVVGGGLGNGDGGGDGNDTASEFGSNNTRLETNETEESQVNEAPNTTDPETEESQVNETPNTTDPETEDVVVIEPESEPEPENDGGDENNSIGSDSGGDNSSDGRSVNGTSPLVHLILHQY